MLADFDCAEAVVPEIALQTHSTPYALLPYEGAAFPFLRDDLLLVLSGSSNNDPIRGYSVAYLEELVDKRIFETILPHDRSIAGVDRVVYDAAIGYQSLFAELLNNRGAGPWPHRIFDVAVSPEGWLCTSVWEVVPFTPCVRATGMPVAIGPVSDDLTTALIHPDNGSTATLLLHQINSCRGDS